MPIEATAELVSRKELPRNIRFAEFKYVDHCDGKKLEAYYEPHLINLTTADYEFSVVWVIHSNFDSDNSFQWQKIKLSESDKTIFGNYTVRMKNKFFTSAFSTACLPYVKDLSLDYCEIGSDITLTIQVFYADEVVHSVLDDYDQLLNNPDSFDVKFTVDGEEIPACKVILSSRSNVFAKMFVSDMVEKKTNKVVISDIESSVFKKLLRFVYCGKLHSGDFDELLKLIIAADKYEIPTLVSTCGYRISNFLTTANVASALVVADGVRDDALKRECMDFIIEHKKNVICEDSFKSMTKSHVHLLVEMFARMK